MTAIQAEYMTAEYRLPGKSSQVQKEATSQYEVHTTLVIKFMHLGLIEVHVSQLVYQQKSGVIMFRLAGRPDTPGVSTTGKKIRTKTRLLMRLFSAKRRPPLSPSSRPINQ
jgi:hypothetical protein